MNFATYNLYPGCKKNTREPKLESAMTSVMIVCASSSSRDNLGITVKLWLRTSYTNGLGHFYYGQCHRVARLDLPDAPDGLPYMFVIWHV